MVDNRPGAGGQIAAQALKAASPDGNTLFVSHDHTISILPLVMKNPGYDAQQDFVPVAGFATFVNALAVSGGTPAKTMNEYTNVVKAQGNKGTVGVPAPASVPSTRWCSAASPRIRWPPASTTPRRWPSSVPTPARAAQVPFAPSTAGRSSTTPSCVRPLVCHACHVCYACRACHVCHA